MSVQDQIGVFVEADGHSVRFHVRCRTRLPEQKMAVGIEYLRLNSQFHSAESRPRLLFLQASGLPAIHQHVGVVHESFVARADFDGFQPVRSIDRGPKNKIPVGVRAAAGSSNGSVAWTTTSGLPSCQPSTNCGLAGKSAGSPSIAPCSTHVRSNAICRPTAGGHRQMSDRWRPAATEA